MSEVPGLKGIEDRASLTHRSYEAIRHAIVDGQLKPDMKLTVDYLADQLNVSRTPVKEALVRLEREGLVHAIANRGYFVAVLSRDDIVEILCMREVLEGLSARLACSKLTQGDLQRLDGYIQACEKAIQGEDRTTFDRNDRLFHRYLSSKAGGRTADVLRTLDDQMRLVPKPRFPLDAMQCSVEEHRVILEALRDGDEERAEALTAKHVRRILKGRLEAASEGIQSAGLRPVAR